MTLTRVIKSEQFAPWLSGFIDGEGCFFIGWIKSKRHRLQKARVSFVITLRGDDIDVLYAIQDYFGCGRVLKRPGVTNPVCRFEISAASELVDSVIPHFEKHPLLSKKARDFEIWREAVLLCDKVSRRRGRSLGCGRGSRSKWTLGERKRFDRYLIRLRELRKFAVSA